MKRIHFKAIATINENGKIYEVCIYSLYKTIEEAKTGIENFKKHYNILDARIERA